MDYLDYCLIERILLLANKYAKDHNIQYIKKMYIPPDWDLQLREEMAHCIDHDEKGNCRIKFVYRPLNQKYKWMSIIPEHTLTGTSNIMILDNDVE